ncbi:MAG TPA: iron ABC transporter permease [Casimicrobiaceae bacterium]|jgi:iron(III) transport system permease protein|nr:iron ABC transporter permease [Casimicrobiaceae bacterium]
MVIDARSFSLPRVSVVAITALVIFLPLGLIFWQSFLSAPFFNPARHLSLGAYAFIFEDADFWTAFLNSIVIATGMVVIALPLGAALAFLLTRTDLPLQRTIEVLVLIPVFVSPMVLAFGYVVAMGPVGFYSTWASALFGGVPWRIYSLTSIAVIAGLTHVPHVYLYSSAALKSLGSDVEEAARVVGANPLKVALNVSLPMTMPALFYAAVLVFFLGFELFGLPLVLGDPEGHLVLSTYLFKLTNKLGTPSYHLMAAVAVCIVAVTFPLVLLQRWLLKSAGKYVSVKGKATRQKLLPLRGWKWVALGLVALWLVFTIVVPISGITLRAFVEQWGEGINLVDVLTLDNFRGVFDQADQVRAIINTLLIGTVGGALAVACYTAIGLAGHRQRGGVARILDYIVLIPRAIPGILAGLAFLWIFLFVPGLKELRNSIFSVWLAYTVVWLAYGMRLISSALLQIGPELEESARTAGASSRRVLTDVTIPLIRFGLLASWVLVFMIFEREYSTGVYLLGQGTEVIGSMLVSLWGAGAIDQVAALSLINIALVAVGLAVALRFGVRLHE